MTTKRKPATSAKAGHAKASGTVKQTSANSKTAGIGRGTPGPGRRKGIPNKNTQALKDAILHAFDKVGGVSYLEMVAKSDPRTFCTLLGKVLPMTVSSDPDQPVRLEVSWAQSSA